MAEGGATAVHALRSERRVVMVDDAAGLDALFDDETALVAWRAPALPDGEIERLTSRLGRSCRLRLSRRTAAEEVSAGLDLPPSSQAVMRLVESIRVFADLTETEEVGLRLSVESRPSCPRFHVDRVALRAVCVWHGATTEWVDDADVLDRRKLGHGAAGVADETSGLLRPGAVVHRLPLAAVAFFKGDAWPGLEGRGLVHRSPPAVGVGRERILWTLDAIG